VNVDAALIIFAIGGLYALITARRSSYAFTFVASLALLPGAVSDILKGPQTGHVEMLSSLLLLLVSVGGALLSLYLLAYSMKKPQRLPALGMNGALLSAVLLLTAKSPEGLTVAYELFSLFTFAIVLGSGTRGSLKAARTYLLMMQVFGAIPLVIAGNIPSKPVLASALILSAAFVRSGVFPLHSWVSRVYRSVPSPFVPLFILGEGLGFYLLVWTESWHPLPAAFGYVLALAGTVSTFATLYSFREIKLKRKFAFHSVMDVGVAYFGLGIAVVMRGTPAGALALTGAVLHTLYQMTYKSAIFLGVGAIEHYGEEPNVCSIKKLLRGKLLYPLISLPLSSMVGIPPLPAFISKLMIYGAALESGDVPILLMLGTVAFLGAFPLASLLQIRRINRLLCKREVERDEIPLSIRTVIGTAGLLSVGMMAVPFTVGGFHWTLNWTYAVSAAAILLAALGTGWKIGRMPTDRVSELLLIFYNMGDILRLVRDFFIETARDAYLMHVAPVFKEIPRHERPLIKSCDDAFRYRTRHIDEAMFMPLIGLVARLAESSSEKSLDMNQLIGGLVIALAVLIMLLGVMS